MRVGPGETPEHRVVLIDTLVGLEELRGLWVASPRHALADFDFFVTIASVRVATTHPFVLVLYRNDTPVALLVGRLDDERRPIRIGYATLARPRLRQVRFIAGGFLGETSLRNFARLVEAVEKLLHGQGLGVAVFEEMAPGGAHDLILATRASRSGAWRHTRLEPVSTHWRLRLPATWSAFLDERGAKHRYWINRLPRVLEKNFPGRWQIDTFVTPADAEAFLDSAEIVAATTYHRTLGTGFRRDAEYTERVRLDARCGRLRAYVLSIDGVPSAFWYCLIYGGTLHLIATAYHPFLRRHELGTILLMRIFRDHCGSPVTEVDFGLGDAGYKQRFASECRLEGPVHLFMPSLRGFYLWVTLGALAGVNHGARRLVEALQLTQTLKTSWRRRLGLSAGGAGASAGAIAD